MLITEQHTCKYSYNKPSSQCVEGHIFGATVKSLQEGSSSHLVYSFPCIHSLIQPVIAE